MGGGAKLFSRFDSGDWSGAPVSLCTTLLKFLECTLYTFGGTTSFFHGLAIGLRTELTGFLMSFFSSRMYVIFIIEAEEI
ncbi:hypothetical protein Syun_014562 [Stephania yunnanensis]|uniref:Uncharacterized protein n=1 Tax=Stephania yunnanensis TaxID=152371 RepID=A0AAP0P8X6_9MAGN